MALMVCYIVFSSRGYDLNMLNLICYYYRELIKFKTRLMMFVQKD